MAAGLAGTLGLIQALGDARIVAPLWALTGGAMGTAADQAPTCVGFAVLTATTKPLYGGPSP